MRKFGKFLLTCFLLFVAIYVFLFLKKFCFLRIKISDDFYIQQKPFVDNYVLKKTDKTTLVEYVTEWRIDKGFLYGCSYYSYFIYELDSEKMIFFDNLHSFYEYIDNFDLLYTMDNCERIYDYTKGINCKIFCYCPSHLHTSKILTASTHLTTTLPQNPLVILPKSFFLLS